MTRENEKKRLVDEQIAKLKFRGPNKKMKGDKSGVMVSEYRLLKVILGQAETLPREQTETDTAIVSEAVLKKVKESTNQVEERG